MKYYVSDKKLYTTEIPFNNPEFTEITEEEYLRRVQSAKANREQGTPASDLNNVD